jgi:WD40 repeat protein
MNESEFWRIYRQWMADGPVEISDRVLSAALGEVQATRQRRTGLIDRLTSMKLSTQLAGTAVAGVVLAVLGAAWLGQPSNYVGVESSPSPSTSVRPPEHSTVIPNAIGLAFSPDGGQVYARGPELAGTVYDARTGEVIRRINPASGSGENLSAPTAWGVEAFSPDGQLIAIGMTEGGSRLYDTATGTLVRQFLPCCMATFSPDGRYLASMSDVIDVETGEVVNTLPLGGDITFSPDGTRLLLSGRGSDTLNGDFPAGSVGAIVDALEPGGETILLRGEGNATLWNILGSGAAWSGDGAMVAQPTSLGNALVWDAETGEVLYQVQRVPNTGIVMSVAFSPDSTQLATGMSDGSVILWDSATHDHIAVLRAAPRLDNDEFAVLNVAFSPDGQRLMGSTGSAMGSKVWDLTP